MTTPPDERPADAPHAPIDHPADDTIDPESEVDEASYESFPASDPPAFSAGTATPDDYEDDSPSD